MSNKVLENLDNKVLENQALSNQDLKNFLHTLPNFNLLFQFCQYLSKYGLIRLVGGCVRDLLLGMMPDDIDLSTELKPEEIIKLSRKYVIPALHQDNQEAPRRAQVIPTGIKHGTVTVILGSFSVEITTLRHDVQCDGRHARVEFTNNFYEDAIRRDFTINAMSYCLIENKLYDYFGGIQHLKDRQVIFVGDALTRIHEDYLRIMRFFRFSKYYAKFLDSKGYEACIALSCNLHKLSQERITSELNKIFSCSHNKYSYTEAEVNNSEMEDEDRGEAVFKNRAILFKGMKIEDMVSCMNPIFSHLRLPKAGNRYNLVSNLENLWGKIQFNCEILDKPHPEIMAASQGNLQKSHLLSYAVIFEDLSFIKSMKLSNQDVKIAEYNRLILEIYYNKLLNLVPSGSTITALENSALTTHLFIYKLIFNRTINKELIINLVALSLSLGLISRPLDLNLTFPIDGNHIMQLGYKGEEIKKQLNCMQEKYISERLNSEINTSSKEEF